jgi:hypothetical protein
MSQSVIFTYILKTVEKPFLTAFTIASIAYIALPSDIINTALVSERLC